MCGRADTSFDDQRLKRLFGCWGWKLPPDWCMNIITPDKKHLCTHPHSIFQMDFKVTDAAVATQPCYLWYCGALWSKKKKKKKEMKNRKRNWAQSVGQSQPAERRRADTDISEDVKGGQTSACAAGNYCVRYCTSCAWLKNPTQAAAERPGKKQGTGIHPQVCHSHSFTAWHNEKSTTITFTWVTCYRR